jgi:hypothetical protein
MATVRLPSSLKLYIGEIFVKYFKILIFLKKGLVHFIAMHQKLIFRKYVT